MNIFHEIGLSQLPRILGLIDRDPNSMTYGCCDRNYWHYKVVDFPNSRLQEAALILGLVFHLDVSDNRFFASKVLKDWIYAVINFWSRRRHADGSTDESYPYERHFCSTAFTLYSVTETLMLMGSEPTQDLRSTGHFLIKHDNKDVANQMACSATALFNLYILTRDERFQKAADKKIDKLLLMQNDTGFFNEYGGFDLGYDSITLSFLAELYQKDQRDDIKKAAASCINNMSRYIDEHGYFNPGNMSRRTQFIYPYGFSIFAPDVLDRLKVGLQNNFILNPAWMDDRYCIPFAGNYLKMPI